MARRTLDLTTGRPVWDITQLPVSLRPKPLLRDLKTEVLVVGMGVSGAMLAEALTAAGHGVVMIDRRGPARGSTLATTALVQFEIDQPLSLLSAKIGQARARRAWRRSRLALANLAGRIAELGIDCDAEIKPSLYLAGNLLRPTALTREGEQRRQAGLRATYLTAGALAAQFGLERAGALLSGGNLALDPVKLTAGLLTLAMRRGARLYGPADAADFSEAGGEVAVSTGAGPVIVCRHLVLATGYELLAKVPANGHSIVSTYAIATRPQRGFDAGALPLIWEAADPYLYLRPTADGRLICGGEDEEFQDEKRRDALLADKAAALSRKLKALLPQADPQPEFAWTGSFGSSGTGLPSIGLLPGSRRVFAVMGYGGNGITYSQIGSEIVAGAIAGITDQDADLFELKGRG